MEGTFMELPRQMSNLDIMETDTSIMEDDQDLGEQTKQRRVLRKRKPLTTDICKPDNRRAITKPCKRVLSDNAKPKEIEAIYLNRKVKVVSQTLETIYEEPKTDNGTESYIGNKKVKRLLKFSLGNQITKDKVKKRRAKIKKLLGNKTFLNRKKIPMDIFLKSIECGDLDEPMQSGSSVQCSGIVDL